MKRCLFFFLALVVAISLALLTESPVVDDLQDQTASNYIKDDMQSPEVPEEGTAVDLADAYGSQSQNP